MYCWTRKRLEGTHLPEVRNSARFFAMFSEERGTRSEERRSSYQSSQMYHQNLNVGRGDARDARGLAERGGPGPRELLPRLGPEMPHPREVEPGRDRRVFQLPEAL